MLDWLADLAEERGTHFDIDVTHPRAAGGAGDPLVTCTGSFMRCGSGDDLSAKDRPAWWQPTTPTRCVSLADVASAMEAGNCAGAEMQDNDGPPYAPRSAARPPGMKGKGLSATPMTGGKPPPLVRRPAGLGTMPHA